MKQAAGTAGTVGLLLAGVLAGPAARAQGGGGYSAPGFPMQLGRMRPAPPAAPAAAAAPEAPLLLRFWHDDQNGPQRASDFYKYMSTYLKYPDAAAKVGMVGHVFVRLSVGPSGQVTDARLVRSRTTSQLVVAPAPADAAAATAALEAETLRIFRAARFSAAKAKTDTVTVSASFQIEQPK